MDEYNDEGFNNLPEYEQNRIKLKIERDKAYLEYLKTEVYDVQSPLVEKRLGPYLPPPIVLRSLEPVKKVRRRALPKPRPDPSEPRPPPRRSGRLKRKKTDRTVYMGDSDDEDKDSSSSEDWENEYSPPAKRVKTTHYADYSAPPSVAEVTPTMIANVAKPGRKKVYSQQNGTTCHQCRQKTIDQKTICRSGRCIGGRGLLCTRCLYTRYGEEVADALLNPNWVCPHCLKECNASICRSRMGLPPTGQIYSLIAEKYGNVRDFLHQTEGKLHGHSANTSGYCSSEEHKLGGLQHDASVTVKVDNCGAKETDEKAQNNLKQKQEETVSTGVSFSEAATGEKSDKELGEASCSTPRLLSEDLVKLGVVSIPFDWYKPPAPDSDDDEKDFKGFRDYYTILF